MLRLVCLGLTGCAEDPETDPVTAAGSNQGGSAAGDSSAGAASASSNTGASAGTSLEGGAGGAVPAAGSGGASAAGAGSGGTSAAGATAGGAGQGTGGDTGGTAGENAMGGSGLAGSGGSEQEPDVDTAGSGGASEGGAGGDSSSVAGADADGGAAGDTSSGTLGCRGDELLCEDFEGFGDGEVPTGGPWHELSSDCEFQATQFSMGVSGENARGGSQSLKILNKHFAQCRLSGEFEPADEFWVRAYMYWDPDLDTSDRETLAMDLTPGFRTQDDPAVRFGYRSKAPCTEYAGPQVTIIGIGGGEATGCGSRELPRGQWYCFEAHVQQTGPIEVRTYIDGEAVTYQSIGKPQTESVKTEGDVTERLDNVRLGLFSTGEAQGFVYVDELAVTEARLGCAE